MRRSALLVVFAMAACAVSPSIQPTTNLGIENFTTVPLTLFVNGNPVAAITPGGVQPSVDRASLPPLPWTVEARTDSGLVLGQMLTGPYRVNDTVSEVFDVACGTITVWTGESAPPSPDAQPIDPSALPLLACGP